MTQSQRSDVRPTRLLNRNFVLLAQGQAVSQLGTQLFDIAMLLWIKQATGSASLVGLLMMVSSIPGVVLGPVGGTVADLFSRRKIIVAMDLLDGLSISALAVLMLLMPDETELILACLFVVSVLGAIDNAFFAPAITAAIPDIVPRDQLTRANGTIQASMRVMGFIGQGLGGMLFRLVGAPLVFLFNGLTFLFSAVSEMFVSIPQKLTSKGRRLPPSMRPQMTVARVGAGGIPVVLPPNKRYVKADRLRPFLNAALEGFMYIWRRSGLRELVIGSAGLAFFTAPLVVLLPFFIEDVLAMGSEWYGFFLATFGVGSLVGAVIAGLLRVSGKTRGKLLVALLMLQAGGFVVLSMLRSIGPTMAVAALGGCLSGIVGTYVITIIQASTPSAMRGRVVSMVVTLGGALSPIAMGLSGVVADLTGQNIPAIYLGCGISMFVLSFFLSANRNFRRFVSVDFELSDLDQVDESESPEGTKA